MCVKHTFKLQNQEPTEDPKNEGVIEVLPCAFEEEYTEERKNEEDIEVIPDAFKEACNIYLVCSNPTVTTTEANETPTTNEHIPEIQHLAKKMILISAAQFLFVIIIFILGFFETSISSEDIIANPWLFIPKVFLFLILIVIFIPSLYFYRSQNLRRHVMQLIYDVFPCVSADNIIDVME